ncbi:MAG: hypothetical protein AAGI66_08285 [Cyanobacteria bacterium P01_H01_bin.74]
MTDAKQKQSNISLGYISIISPGSNQFIGGLMVTDSRGLPVEFRYTEPVQPSKIQQVLYGGILGHYIKQEVILETLLKNCELKPHCLLTEDESLLEAQLDNLPVYRIQATKMSPVGNIGTVVPGNDNDFLVQTSSTGNPVRLYTQAKPEATAGTGQKNIAKPAKTAGRSQPSDLSKNTQLSVISDLITHVGESLDLTEPLDRVQKALGIICQEMKENSQETASKTS